QSTQGDDDVMGDGDRGDHAVPEVETEGHVDQDARYAREDGVEGLELEITPYLGTDELEPPDLDRAARRPRQGVLHLFGERLGLLSRLMQPDQIFLGVAELLDDGLAQLDLVEAAPDNLHGHR